MYSQLVEMLKHPLTSLLLPGHDCSCLCACWHHCAHLCLCNQLFWRNIIWFYKFQIQDVFQNILSTFHFSPSPVLLTPACIQATWWNFHHLFFLQCHNFQLFLIWVSPKSIYISERLWNTSHFIYNFEKWMYMKSFGLSLIKYKGYLQFVWGLSRKNSLHLLTSNLIVCYRFDFITILPQKHLLDKFFKHFLFGNSTLFLVI